MESNKFLPEYRTDVKRFLDSPGGKYYLQALIAKEVEFTVQAAKGETADIQVKYINQFAGINIARDILQRFGEPSRAVKKQD